MKSVSFIDPLNTDSSVHLYHKKIDLIPILKGTVITHIVVSSKHICKSQNIQVPSIEYTQQLINLKTVTFRIIILEISLYNV